MKKLLSILLAGAMVFGLASAAMADPLTGNADAPSSQNVDISVEIGESFEWSVPAEIKMTDTGTAMKSDDYTIEISKAVLAPSRQVVLRFSTSDYFISSYNEAVITGSALLKCGDASLFYNISLNGFTYPLLGMSYRTSDDERADFKLYGPTAPWKGEYRLEPTEGAASVTISAAVVDKQFYDKNVYRLRPWAEDAKEMFYGYNHVAGDYSTSITFEALLK